MRYINPDKETTTEEKHARAIILCRNCITYAAYMTRISHAHKSDKAIGFWMDAYNSFLYLFVIDWCILFKKSRNNHLYWGNLIPDESKTDFQDLMLKGADFTLEQYEKAAEAIINFRDTMVAHMDNTEIYYNAPSTYIGEKAACFLYDHLLSTGKFPAKFPVSKMPKSYVLWNERAQQAENALTLHPKPKEGCKA